MNLCKKTGTKNQDSSQKYKKKKKNSRFEIRTLKYSLLASKVSIVAIEHLQILLAHINLYKRARPNFVKVRVSFQYQYQYLTIKNKNKKLKQKIYIKDPNFTKITPIKSHDKHKKWKT